MTSRSTIFRNGSDEELRRLEREAANDPSLLGRLVQGGHRTGSYGPAVNVMIAGGWEAANALVSPMNLEPTREALVLALGRELTARGWAPDLPLSYEVYRADEAAGHARGETGDTSWRHCPGSKVMARYGQRSLVRSEPPVKMTGDFGHVRSWRFAPSYGFTRVGGGPPVAEPPANQGASFFFEIEPQGRNHAAGRFVRDVLETRSARLRRIAPRSWFLSRWDDAQATTIPMGRGGQGLWAGLSFHWPSNPLYSLEISEGAGRHMRPEDRTPEARAANRGFFLSGTRAGWLPGDVAPAPGTPHAQVESWATNPERVEAIGALFYGDLFLGGLLIPPERLAYDPATLGPRLS